MKLTKNHTKYFAVIGVILSMIICAYAFPCPMPGCDGEVIDGDLDQYFSCGQCLNKIVDYGYCTECDYEYYDVTVVASSHRDYAEFDHREYVICPTCGVSYPVDVYEAPCGTRWYDENHTCDWSK